MTVVLSVNRLHYAYPGGIAALHDLHLEVPAGRKLAILGPNGAGKSTLLLHLNGSFRPDQGTVFLADQPGDYTRRGLNGWRSHVALVLQDPDDQIFAATVAEDVSFGPLNQGLSEADTTLRVQSALAALGIADLADRPTHMLSGGQKKRVAIAGAVAMQPDVLLLDEPTAGLDREGADQVIALLLQLAEQGMTLVFSTHDIDLAFALADDVALFQGGTVLAQGRAHDVLADRELLSLAGLRPPVLIDLWLRAKACGFCPDGAPLPQTPDAFLSLLARQQPVG